MKIDPSRSSTRGASVARAGFAAPDFQRPFDLAAELAAIPPEATVRGMFLQMIDDHAKATIGTSLLQDETPAFANVPTRTYVELLARAAATIHPRVSVREGIRRLGQRVFDDFYATMVGKAIFAVAGRNFDRLATLAPKAYEVSYSPCTAKAEVLAPGHVHIAFAPMFVLAETFHVGAWEGAARFCKGTADVLVNSPKKPGHFEYEIRFTPD